MSGALQAAPQAYNAASEQQFRNRLEERDRDNLKRNRAVDRILMLNSTGEPGELTIVAGVPTWTAL